MTTRPGQSTSGQELPGRTGSHSPQTTSSSLPKGTGPYTYGSWDSATGSSHLTRNYNSFDLSDCGKPALQSNGQFQVKYYLVRTIVGGDQPITALSNGEVAFLDSQYHLE